MTGVLSLPMRSTHPLSPEELSKAGLALVAKGTLSDPSGAWDDAATSYVYAVVDLERALTGEEPYIHIGVRRPPVGRSPLTDELFFGSGAEIESRRRAGAKLALFVLSAWRDDPGLSARGGAPANTARRIG